jgi:hypothetical protein
MPGYVVTEVKNTLQAAGYKITIRHPRLQQLLKQPFILQPSHQ